jgi:hypothetical protein
MRREWKRICGNSNLGKSKRSLGFIELNSSQDTLKLVLRAYLHNQTLGKTRLKYLFVKLQEVVDDNFNEKDIKDIRNFKLNKCTDCGKYHQKRRLDLCLECHKKLFDKCGESE